MKVSGAMKQMFNSDSSLETEIRTGEGGYKWGLTWFISTGVSSHQYGIAVDLTLCDVTSSTDVTVGDTTVGLPDAWTAAESYTPMHELSAKSAKYTDPSKKAKTTGMQGSSTAQLLHDIMTGAGMQDLASEWWHFQDGPKQSISENMKKDKGNFTVTECLSTAPDKAESEGGVVALGASGEGEAGGPTGDGSGTGTGTGTGTGSGGGGGSSTPADPVVNYIEKYVMTDEDGNYHFQWNDPSDIATYLPPGQYTVTEIKPPAGYAKGSTPSEAYLVLHYDMKTGTST